MNTLSVRPPWGRRLGTRKFDPAVVLLGERHGGRFFPVLAAQMHSRARPLNQGKLTKAMAGASIQAHQRVLERELEPLPL